MIGDPKISVVMTVYNAALYLREATMLRDSTIQLLLSHRHLSTQLIAAFFTPLSPLRVLKRPSSSISSTGLSKCAISRSGYLH